MDTTEGKEFKPELKDGLVGRQIVAWFAEHNGTVAVNAVALDGGSTKQMDYTISFEHGVAQAYRVTFGDTGFLQVADITPLN